MKRFLFSFLLSTSVIFVHAQQDYKAILASIIKNSETDFLKITGNKLPDSEEGYTDYESKLKLSDETDIIIKKNNSNRTFYYHVSTHRNKEALEGDVYDYIKDKFPDSEFDTEFENMGYDGAYYKITIYRKEEEIPFIVMSLTSDVHINTQFSISVYGKSATQKD